jgi:MFS family permease
MVAMQLPGTALPGASGKPTLRTMLGPAGRTPLILLMALAVTQNFDVAAFGVLSPNIRHTFHLDNAGIDSIAALTAALPVMCAIFLGYVGDRSNRVRLAAASAVLFAVAAIFTGLAPVVGVLIAARLAGGVGLLASQTIYPSLLSDYYPPQVLAQVFTVFLIGAAVLGLVGSPLAGFVGQELGWRSAFVLLALPTFAIVVAVVTTLKEPTRRPLHAPADVIEGGSIVAVGGTSPDALELVGLPSAEPFGGSIADGFRGVRSIRTLRRTWASAFLFGAGTIPLATFVSNFFHDVYHLNSAARGGIGALLGFGGLVGIVVGGLIAQKLIAHDRVDLFPAVTGLFVVEFALFAFIMAIAPDKAGSVTAAFVLAMGAIGFLPTYYVFVSVISPPQLRSQAYAWSLFFYGLGAICLGSVIGVYADKHGQRPAMVLLSILVLGGGFLAASAKKFVKGDLERLHGTT